MHFCLQSFKKRIYNFYVTVVVFMEGVKLTVVLRLNGAVQMALTTFLFTVIVLFISLQIFAKINYSLIFALV